MLTQDQQDEVLRRLGEVATMLGDCSAVVVIHVSDNGGALKFSAYGNVYTQLGAIKLLEHHILTHQRCEPWNDFDTEEAP